MSVLDQLASAPPTSKSSGPVQYRAAEEAVFDSVTNRTYQLVERSSDSVPHCASRAGNHASAMLAQLNTSKRLNWQRGQLQDQLKDSRLSDSKRKAATADVERLTAEIKEAPAVNVERCDRAARMLFLYG